MLTTSFKKDLCSFCEIVVGPSVTCTSPEQLESENESIAFGFTEIEDLVQTNDDELHREVIKEPRTMAKCLSERGIPRRCISLWILSKRARKCAQ